MGNFCRNCGSQIKEQSNFCEFCGTPAAPVQQNLPYQPNDPFSQPPVQPNDPFLQQNPYQPVHQPYQQHILRAKRENHITFIFVTSLVFMIIFAIKCISALSIIQTNHSYKGYYQDIYIAGLLNILIVFIAFAAALVFFIFAAASRNRSNHIEKRIRSSEILFILSITALSLGIIYLMSDIYYVAVYASHSNDSYYLISNTLSVFIFDAAFITFSIINVVKSRLFKSDLKQKFQNADNEKST